MSILNVNKINPVGGGSTITIAGIASVTSSVTAPSFVGAVTGDVTGNVTGNVTGDATGLSGNPSINTTGIVTATSFVPTVGQLSHRNIIINGAMTVAQRGTSSTTSGYGSVDRFRVIYSGTDEAPTHAQVDVASGTTPYTLGFRKALKITNGNQTSGAGSGDYIIARYKVEAQDMATSGWNYTSSSSNVTLQFWIKSSVAQNFYFNLISADGTLQNYAYETGSLSADTWTKVTKTISGASNIQFDNDNGVGLQIDFWAFAGTDFTASSVTLNQWAAYSSGNRMPDHPTTWYTTNDATLEITGVQLEVGPVATPFEHRSFADELLRCKRYFQGYIQYGEYVAGGTGNLGLPYTAFTVPMRASPTFVNTVEDKSSNWSFASMQVQGSVAEGYYAYAISYNTTNSNYGYMRRAGTASAEL